MTVGMGNKWAEMAEGKVQLFKSAFQNIFIHVTNIELNALGLLNIVLLMIY